MALTTSPSTTSNFTSGVSTPMPVSTPASAIDGAADPNKSPATTSTISPVVATSNAAQSDLNNIKSNHAAINTGIQTQAANVAAQQAQADAKAKVDAQAKQDATIAQKTADTAATTANAKMAAVSGAPVADPYMDLVGKTGYNPITGKTDTIENIGKAADGSYMVSFASTPNSQYLQSTDLAKFNWTPDQIAQEDLNKTNEAYKTEATNVQNTINGIINGTVPFNDGQIAQINGLKQQFQQMIDQQVLTNTNAYGVANVRGYQTGAAEYDPSFQVRTINSIIGAGQNKIADLNIKMAAAVAEMTESFKDNNIKRAKEAWNIYQEATKNRQDALQKTIDSAQKKIKEAQDQKAKADKVIYDEVTKPIMDISSTLAKTPGVPAEVTAAVSKAKTVGEAIQAAGEYLQTSTNADVSQYLLYKRQTERNGGTAISFDEWKIRNDQAKANIEFQKAYNRAAGTVAGKGGTPNGTVAGKGVSHSKTTAAQSSQGYSSDKAQITLNTIDTALSQIDKYTTGTVYGQVAGMIPGTAAKDLQKNIDTIKANIGLDELTRMKEVSKTGASGLGNLTGKELDALQASLGNLDRAQSPAQLRANLLAVKDHYTKAMGYIDQIQNGGVGTDAVLSANGINQQAFQQIKADYPNMSDKEILDEMRAQKIIK